MYNFGAGRAIVYPAGGGSGLELGTVQNASLELKVEMKELRGAWRFPVAVADGKGTASGKVTFANIWPQTIAAVTGGSVSSGGASGTWPSLDAGGVTAAIAETGYVSASTPFEYVLANGGTTSGFQIGSEIVSVIIPSYGPVYYIRGAAGSEVSATASGPPAAGVAGPTGGVYSIANAATSTLTFAAGDAGRTVKITYLFSATTATTGSDQVAVQLAQVGMNTALTFTMLLMGIGRNIYNNSTQNFIIQLQACLAPSLKLDFKLDDWTMMDVDFSAFVDLNGNLATFFLLSP